MIRTMDSSSAVAAVASSVVLRDVFAHGRSIYLMAGRIRRAPAVQPPLIQAQDLFRQIQSCRWARTCRRRYQTWMGRL